MASAPFQPIPDSTQVHVDRLVGSKLGLVEVGARIAEGRFGTLYSARNAGKDVTLEVLRTELTGDDQEVKASNAIKCTGIANVSDFGQVPDGRRYRVMELLDGQSLLQRLEQRGRLGPPEVARLLGQVAEVLEAAHAWAVPHGNLGPSSVFVVRTDTVKLIDFGLAKQGASIEGDLQALGALGFALLTGEELAGRAPPPLGSGIPEPIDRLLRELLEKRVKDATEARKELALILPLLETPPVPATPKPTPRRSRAVALAAFAFTLAGACTAAFFFWPREPAPEPPVAVEEDEGILEDATDVEPEEPKDPSQLTQPEPRPTSPTGPRRSHVVPSASALMQECSSLESRFRKQVRPGDDIDQALFVLNKQRLRLTGSPTEQDRKDVARQLAGWKRSYLRR